MDVLNTNVLGTEYAVMVGTRKELDLDKDKCGQCAYYIPSISIEHSLRLCDTEHERDGRTAEIVAHEVFHAYAHESGLAVTEEQEEYLAQWYERMWRKMNNSIVGILDSIGILDNVK